ncbi:golgin candidate 6-like [Iris pallida]|uniref:Golgin candidate 6-like n=1 Tax=Iris pallida TaxID=29817 RepID=A0AAX6FFN2_IRIPA|nr:golgin candidate 6-like [Iris pallida]
MQGVGGRVFGALFGNDGDSGSREESHVERYLDRINNGVLAEDRRAAMTELQSLVAESSSAQLAIGAIGIPVLLSVLKEERDDVEMIRGALETLVSALTSTDTTRTQKNEVQPALMNSELLSWESESISLLLNLLSEDDFYVRYYTLQLLTVLLTHSSSRLQEAVLSIPCGITRLMDMLMDREVIRNEALLLLTYLTREAEEIQKIVVFEGAFEKIFSIIKEEGGSDGGVVVQDCLQLLNNLIGKNTSNQVLLRETIGFEPLASILKLRRGTAYNFTQQKTINLLKSLETVELLLTGGPDGEAGTDVNRLSNQNALAQKNILDHFLTLGVDSPWALVAVRCLALRCIGNLLTSNPQNQDSLASKFVGEEPHAEPALNGILRVVLRTSIIEEFIAADYVFKCFCEKNKDGQAMLASTMAQPHPTNHSTFKENDSMSPGSLLLQGLISTESNEDLEACCRAASVLSHVLKDNLQCKELVLKVELEAPLSSFSSTEPLLHRIVKHLAHAAAKRNANTDESSTAQAEDSYIQPLILRLLITWLADCPAAVDCFLHSPAHLTYVLELVRNSNASVCVRGFAAVLLGECVLFNKSSESNRDSFAVVDAISQKIGLAAYFLNFDELKKMILSLASTSVHHHEPVTRSSSASLVEMNEIETDGISQKHDHSILQAIFDPLFVNFIKRLEVDIRERIVEVFGHTKNKFATVPAELEQKGGETETEYIKRLKSFVEKQCHEMQDLVARNATLADELVRTGSEGTFESAEKSSSIRDRVQAEARHRELEEAARRTEMLKSEKSKAEAAANNYQNLAGKLESDLKSLSDAYNSLEQDNFRLEMEVKALRKGGTAYPDVEAIREEARVEAQKESEAELNDLLVCLGQEQSKVERLSSRLVELGEDVDALLEGIGDDAAIADDDDNEDNTDGEEK